MQGLMQDFPLTLTHLHQRAAVARILREGRCLLAHAVGAGKTAILWVRRCA